MRVVSADPVTSTATVKATLAAVPTGARSPDTGGVDYAYDVRSNGELYYGIHGSITSSYG